MVDVRTEGKGEEADDRCGSGALLAEYRFRFGAGLLARIGWESAPIGGLLIMWKICVQDYRITANEAAENRLAAKRGVRSLCGALTRR